MRSVRAAAVPALAVLLMLTILFSLTGCRAREAKEIRTYIETEMELLKSNDTETISAFISDSGLPEDLDKEELPAKVIEVFSLFFQNFDYSIKQIEIDDTGEKASVLLELKTIDARSLAKDFTSQAIVKQLQNQASPSRVEYSLEDYYLSLQQLLIEQDYEILDSEYTASLTKKGEHWQFVRDNALENALVGGFVTYAADPELFMPEEIIALHFDTIKTFDTEQMNRFLSLDELFSADDEYKRTIAKALAGQILQYLDYTITGSENDGINASVTVEVTTCDWHSIIQEYTEDVTAYTSTSQALADGISVRLAKANQILLECINSNTSSAASETTLNLVNDGTNWKFQMDNAFVEAILGNIDEAVASVSTSPEEE